MGYVLKLDGNGRPIQNSISTLKRFDVPTTATGEFEVTVPFGAYCVAVKRCPVDAEIKINHEGDFVPVDEGDEIVNVLDLTNLTVKINTVGTSNIVFIFTV